MIGRAQELIEKISGFSDTFVMPTAGDGDGPLLKWAGKTFKRIIAIAREESDVLATATRRKSAMLILGDPVFVLPEALRELESAVVLVRHDKCAQRFLRTVTLAPCRCALVVTEISGTPTYSEMAHFLARAGWFIYTIDGTMLSVPEDSAPALLEALREPEEQPNGEVEAEEQPNEEPDSE